MLGKLTARTTDIREVFEVPLNTDNEQAVLDINYLTEKAEHLTQVTDLEVTKVETRKIFERIPKVTFFSGNFVQFFSREH